MARTWWARQPRCRQYALSLNFEPRSQTPLAQLFFWWKEARPADIWRIPTLTDPTTTTLWQDLTPITVLGEGTFGRVRLVQWSSSTEGKVPFALKTLQKGQLIYYKQVHTRGRTRGGGRSEGTRALTRARACH